MSHEEHLKAHVEAWRKKWHDSYQLYCGGRRAGKTSLHEASLQAFHDSMIFGEGLVRIVADKNCPPNMGFFIQNENNLTPRRGYKGEHMSATKEKTLEVIVNQTENGYLVRVHNPGGYSPKSWVASSEKELGQLIEKLAKETEIKIQKVK